MKMPFLLAVPIAFCVFLAPLARAQNAGLPQEKCTLAGTVIDAISEQPLKGAEVRVRAIPSASAPGSQSVSQSIPQSTSANTDANGRFVFESLSAGRYFLLASEDGYVNNNRAYAGLRGKMLEISPGQHVDDIVIRLLPNGSIAGRIINELGKPLRGVSVEAMKFSYSHGVRELHDVANAPTNDAGEYRIPGLVPGKYYVRAKPPASSHAPPPKSRVGNDKAYIPIYYPVANDQSRAVALLLRAGEDLVGIDMNLAPVHTVNIQGRVINARTFSPSKEAEVTLLSDQGETIFAPAQNFSAGGQANFDFKNVPPGSYVVVAQQPSNPHEQKTMWGRTSIEVKDTNVEHADIVVGPGVDVSGRVRIDGDTGSDLGKELGNMAANLSPREPLSLANLTPDIDNASLKPDGTFLFREVPEGSYQINFFPIPAGFYLKSSGAADVLETGITVSPGHSPPVLEFVLSPGAGRIDGSVETDDQSAHGVSVVLVPDGKGRGQPNYYRQAVTDLMGRFAMRNIIPGDYTLFAWEQIDRGAYFDPEFIGRFEDRGKAVHVEEGGHVTVKLDLIPVTETGP